MPTAAGRRWVKWVALVAFIGFLVDTYLVLSGALLKTFDIPVSLAAQGTNWGPIATLMTLTNRSGGLGHVLLGAAAVVGLFLYDRRAGVVMAVGSLGSVINSVLKVSIARHRPTADLVQILNPNTGYSYPSGHAVFFTWLAFMLAAALAPRLKPPWRIAIWVVPLLVIAIACLGRVWAGAHWPSDVLGGFLLGLSWSAFVLWLADRVHRG
jgi:undecaprenyl-diphosphatase